MRIPQADSGERVGYTDVLSIENEDFTQDRVEGVCEAAAMMRTLLAREHPGMTAAR